MKVEDFLGIFIACFLADVIARRLEKKSVPQTIAEATTPSEPQTLEELYAQEVA